MGAQVHSVDAGYAAVLRRLTLAQSGPTIFRFAREPRRVKNLGWLLRNWRNVRRFYRVDSFLIAEIRGGDWSGFYCCDWASEAVMLDWLKRPVFRGVEIVTLERG